MAQVEVDHLHGDDDVGRIHLARMSDEGWEALGKLGVPSLVVRVELTDEGIDDQRVWHLVVGVVVNWQRSFGGRVGAASHDLRSLRATPHALLAVRLLWDVDGVGLEKL
jgi:hypothetical protein|eukprot:COSAG02_NODE_1234_length_13742_cov_47.916954_2_plen_109_part_00